MLALAARGTPAGWAGNLSEKEKDAPVVSGNVRPFEMKPTRPDSAMGGGGARGGAPPVFFPPSAPIPRAPSRARPTIDDLVRQEVLELPDTLSPPRALATDAHEQSRRARRVEGRGGGCDESMDGSTGSVRRSGGQVRQAAEGHDDLLAWFREQVVEEPEDSHRQKDEIWEGRERQGRGNNRRAREVGCGGGAGEEEKEGEGVMVWGHGGRGRMGKNLLESCVGDDGAFSLGAGARSQDRGRRGLVGAGTGGVEERDVEGLRKELEETEEERRERLLAILESRELLKRRASGGAERQEQVEDAWGEGDTISGGEEKESGEGEPQWRYSHVTMVEPGASGPDDDDDPEDGGFWGEGKGRRPFGGYLGGNVGSGVMDVISGPWCGGGWHGKAREVGWRLLSPEGRTGARIQESMTSESAPEEEGASDSTESCDDGTEHSQTDGSEVLDHGEDEDVRDEEGDEETQERQRCKLLRAALQQARDGLVASLGEVKFAGLYAAVMAAGGDGARGTIGGGCGETIEGEGLSCRTEEGDPWGADEHGWQMLQYVYLETETKRLQDKYDDALDA